mmetsp:Transcript_5204/g.18577  ORF Transcript_5204/g.18577 Transcript_5204/m.18577 type:complete len:505 (+) Transcript_5204:416-1930(+)
MTLQRLLGQPKAGGQRDLSVAVGGAGGSLKEMVHGVHGGVEEDIDHGGREGADLHHQVDSIVRSDGHTIPQDRILEGSEDVERKKLDSIWQRTVVHQPMSSEGLHASALNLASSINQLGVLRLLDRRLEERVHGSGHIDGAVEVHEVLRDGDVEVMNAYPPLAVRGCVEKSTLDADVGACQVLLFMHEVAGEGLVHVAGGEGEEIGTAEVVVAMEGLHFDSTRRPHTKHSFKRHLPRHRPSQVRAKCVGVPSSIEAGVVPELSVGVLGERGDGSQVGVVLTAAEHVDRDLVLGADLKRVSLEHVVGWVQNLRLMLAAKKARVLPRTNGGASEGGDDAMEDHQLSSDVLHHSRGSLQRRIECRVWVDSGAKHAWELAEERLDLLPAVHQVDKQLRRKREEGVIQVSHAEHLRFLQGALKAVEVKARVERDKPNLRPASSRKLVEISEDRVGNLCEQSRLNRPGRYVDTEDVSGRLGRANHVVRRSDILHGPEVELRPLSMVSAFA